MSLRGSVWGWACGALVLAGLGLRFFRLDQPLWYDEALTVRTAALALRDIPFSAMTQRTRRGLGAR